jgi:nicotinamidase/pyrazinamidase
MCKVDRMIRPGPNSALLVIDVQNGFVTGQLAVKDGEQVVPVVNRLVEAFDNVVLTQDWHPPGHISFASTHGKSPFENITLDYGPQVMWPEHCVQGTFDAELHAGLSVTKAQLVIRKGYHAGIDSYSAFMEADRRTMTGLAGYLKERAIDTVYLCGLATDFCVAFSAIDARKAGFEAIVVEDATRAIDLNGSLDAAWAEMTAAGVQRVQSADIVGKASDVLPRFTQEHSC